MPDHKTHRLIFETDRELALRKKLIKSSVDRDQTMRSWIMDAIEQKLEREEKQ